MEALPGCILVPLLILDAGAGMRLPLPIARPFESDVDVVVLATAVLTSFPNPKTIEKIKYVKQETHRALP